MKKLFVLVTALALLVSSLCTVSYADSSANYFEPTYNAENWTVSAPEGASITFDSTAKSIVTSGEGVKTATYNGKALSGDVILTFDAKFGGNAKGNHNKISLGSMIFDFRGNGDFGFTVDKNEEIYQETAYTKSTKNSIVITYKTSGEVNVYDVTSTEQKTVYSYTGSDIADKNDGTFVVEDRYATKITVSNIKMYKSNQSFTDSFGETISDRWDLPSDSTVAANYSIHDDGFMVTNFSSNNSLAKSAMTKQIYTTGSYSIIAELETANTNYQHIIFNKSSDNLYYTLTFKRATTGFTLDLKKRLSSASTLHSATTTMLDSPKTVNGTDDKNSKIVIKLDYLAETGTINVYVNNNTTPDLTATDKTSTMGKVGICFTKTNIHTFKIEPISAEVPEFSVGAISVSGDIAANSTVTGSTTVKNTTNENKDAVIVMAIYKNGEIANVIKTDGVFTAKSGENPFSVSYTFGEIQAADNYKVKCFVFNSLESIVPLTHATSKPAEA